MKHFVGEGKGTSKDAVSQAISGLSNPTGIMFFADYTQLEEVHSHIAEKFPETKIIGIGGSSFYNGSLLDSSDQVGEKKGNSLRVMAFLDESEVQMGVIEDVTGTPIVSLRKFENKIKKINPGRDNTVCITYHTIEEEAVVSTLKPVLKKYKIPMMGGSIGGFFGKGEDSYVLYNGKRYYNACGYLIVKNKVGKVNLYRQDIYEQDGEELLTITKVANGMSRELKQINNNRTDKVYTEKYNVKIADLKKDLVNYTLRNPLGAVIGEEHFVISMADVHDDGTITTFKKVSDGESIVNMKAGDHVAKEGALLDKIKREMPKRSLVFSVDCIYRVIYYKTINYLNNYLEGMASIADHVGIIGVGEQSQDQHFNQTMICVVFE